MTKFKKYMHSEMPAYIAIGGSLPILLMNLLPNSTLKINITLLLLIVQIAHLVMLIYKGKHA